MFNQINEISNSTDIEIGRYKFTLFERSAKDSFKLRKFAKELEESIKAKLATEMDIAIGYNVINTTAVSDSITAWAETLPFFKRSWIKFKYSRKSLIRKFGENKLKELADLVADLEELPKKNGEGVIDEKKKIKEK